MEKESKKKGRPGKGEIRFDLAKAIDLRMQGKSVEKNSQGNRDSQE